MIRPVRKKRSAPPSSEGREFLKTTLNLDLSFVTPTKGDLRVLPVAEVIVKSYSSKACDGTEAPCITAQAITPDEFDYQINRLVAELEAIRKEGHRLFKRHESTPKRKRKPKAGAAEER